MSFFNRRLWVHEMHDRKPMTMVLPLTPSSPQEFSVQCERYGGEDLISCQEDLSLLAQLQDSWVKVTGDR